MNEKQIDEKFTELIELIDYNCLKHLPLRADVWGFTHGLIVNSYDFDLINKLIIENFGPNIFQVKCDDRIVIVTIR